MFYLSKLLGSPVKDVENKSAGTLHDLVVSTRQAYPRVTARRRAPARQDPVRAVGRRQQLRGVRPLLRIPAAELAERELEPDELHLSATFLDKQLVDTEGRKVIRVNDIQLLRNGPFVHVAAVDVSSNAILRRVGLAKVGDRLAKARQKPKPHLIDWKDVDIEQTDEAAVRLAVPQTKLELLHPADIAELVHELSPEERAAVFDALEDDLAADTFEELHPSYQASLLLDLPDEKASEILNEMSPDDAADLLADLPDDRRQHFIAMMEKEDAEDMRELLSYPEHSAGGIMTTDYAWARLDDTADEGHREPARAGGRGVETVYYIYVVDRSEHLRGVFSLRELVMHAARQEGARLHDGEPGLGAHRSQRGRDHRGHRQVQPARPARRGRTRASCTASSPSTTPSTWCSRWRGRSACRGSSIEEASMAQTPRNVGAARSPAASAAPGSSSSWRWSGPASSPPTPATTPAASPPGR